MATAPLPLFSADPGRANVVKETEAPFPVGPDYQWALVRAVGESWEVEFKGLFRFDRCLWGSSVGKAAARDLPRGLQVLGGGARGVSDGGRQTRDRHLGWKASKSCWNSLDTAGHGLARKSSRFPSRFHYQQGYRFTWPLTTKNRSSFQATEKCCFQTLPGSTSRRRWLQQQQLLIVEVLPHAPTSFRQ